MARREEWLEQVKLSRLLDTWLDPACSDWTATDPVAASKTSGVMRKKCGVKPGVPDILIWHRGRSITIEMKSRHGQCSPSQRVRRTQLLRAGAEWWECRSANAAMLALAASDVEFRVIVHKDGRTEHWRQPELAAWELPRRDPAERRPNAPEVAAQRRAAVQRWRARKREREDAQLAPARSDAGLPGAHAVPAGVQRRRTIGGPLRVRMPSRGEVMAAADRAEARSRLNKT